MTPTVQLPTNQISLILLEM